MAVRPGLENAPLDPSNPQHNMLIKDLPPFMQRLSQVCQKQASERKALQTPGVVNVTIAHLNMASREKFYLVKQTAVHDNYDIFVISESWIDPSSTNNDIQIPGYVILRQDKGSHKSGGRIVAYNRNSFKELMIDNLCSTTDTNSQQLWL